MRIPVQMTFRHVMPTDDTFDLIHGLAERLGRTWRDITRCRVVVDRFRRGRGRRGGYRVQVLMTVPGRRLVAQRECSVPEGERSIRPTILETFEAAERLLADSHARQLATDHRRETFCPPLVAPAAPSVPSCAAP